MQAMAGSLGFILLMSSLETSVLCKVQESSRAGKALHPVTLFSLQTNMPLLPLSVLCIQILCKIQPLRGFSVVVDKRWPEILSLPHQELEFVYSALESEPVTALAKEHGRGGAAPAFRRTGSSHFPLCKQALEASAAV